MINKLYIYMCCVVVMFFFIKDSFAVELTDVYLKECAVCDVERQELKKCMVDKEKFLYKIKSLEDTILNHESILIKQIQYATNPLQSRIEEMKKEIKDASLMIEKKEVLLQECQQQQDQIRHQSKTYQNEHVVLLDSLNKLRQELEDVKTRQLEVLVQERIKPYQEKIVVLERAIEEKEASLQQSFQKIEDVYKKTIQKLREELAEKEQKLLTYSSHQ